jgi:hypothetical protein
MATVDHGVVAKIKRVIMERDGKLYIVFYLSNSLKK